VGVLKQRTYPTPLIELNQGHSDKLTVTKIRKGKKYEISNLNFMNNRYGRLISRILRNLKKDHLISISMIAVNDHCSDEEINDFLAL
jgi:hypothetical protein